MDYHVSYFVREQVGPDLTDFMDKVLQQFILEDPSEDTLTDLKYVVADNSGLVDSAGLEYEDVAYIAVPLNDYLTTLKAVGSKLLAELEPSDEDASPGPA